MNIEINKINIDNSERKGKIYNNKSEDGLMMFNPNKNVSIIAGYNDDFWWNIDFKCKDKDGFETDISIQLNEKERIEFMEHFEKVVTQWKERIKLVNK